MLVINEFRKQQVQQNRKENKMSNLTKQQAFEAVIRVDNDRLEDLIRQSILDRLNEPDCELRLQEFDLAVRKDVDQKVFVDMTVFGMAGETTKDSFATLGSDGQLSVIKGGGSFVVKLDDDNMVKLVFNEIVNLNATDYLVIYSLA